jgi:hypothetical protein
LDDAMLMILRVRQPRSIERWEVQGIGRLVGHFAA